MSLTFANKITICRILAVPFFILALLYYRPERESLRFVALGVFLFAVISDVVDGYVARTRHQKTPAGKILDPLADKILLISAFICLFMARPYLPAIHFPLWFVVMVISRDIILIIGTMLIYIFHHKLPIESTRWGKISTFFQVLSVIGMLMQWEFSFVFWYGVVFFTLISGVDYIRHGIRLLNDHAQEIAL